MSLFWYALFLLASAVAGGVMYLKRSQATLGRLHHTARVLGLKKLRSLPGSGKAGFAGTWKGHELFLERNTVTEDAGSGSFAVDQKPVFIPVLTLTMRVDDPRLRILARLGTHPESQMERSVVRLGGEPGKAVFHCNGWNAVEHTHQLRALLNAEAWQELQILHSHSYQRRLRFEQGCISIDVIESRLADGKGLHRFLDRLAGFTATLGDTVKLQASLRANFYGTRNPLYKLWYLDSLHGLSISGPGSELDPDLIRDARASSFFPLKFKALQISPEPEQAALADLLFRTEAKYQSEILDYLTRTGRVEFLSLILERQRGILAQARFKLLPFLLLKPDAQSEKFLLDELTDDIPDDTAWVYACLDSLAKIGTLNAVPVLHRYRRLGSAREVDAAVRAIQSRHSGGAEGWVSVAESMPARTGAVSLADSVSSSRSTELAPGTAPGTELAGVKAGTELAGVGTAPGTELTCEVPHSGEALPDRDGLPGQGDPSAPVDPSAATGAPS